MTLQADQPLSVQHLHRRPTNPLAALPLLVAAAANLVMLVHFPAQPVALGLGLLAAALAVACRPLLIWWIVPAALPVLDLAPWTGRFFWDEFDALLALLLAVAWWRSPAPPQPRHPDRPLRWLLLAVALSLMASTARALLPWPGLDVNAFAGLLQPFNALRIVRGAVWALLLWALARRQRSAGQPVVTAFGHGMVLGLVGAVLFIVAERISFTYLLDFSNEYRVAGPFSAMHTGGAYVEAYLVCAMPFVVARLWPPAPLWRMVACGVLLMAAVYALMVTYSRGGYAAGALAMVLMGVLALRHLGGRVVSVIFGLAIAGLVATVAGVVLMGSFAQSRLATIDQDLVVRENHWARTAGLINQGAPSLLFGMGLGRLPATRLLADAPDDRSASYRMLDQDGQRLVRMGTGQAIFVEQMVDTAPGQTLRVQVRFRGAAPGAQLGIALCEKWLIASANCAGLTLAAGPPGAWTTVTQALPSGDVGAGQSRLPRPVKLSFFIDGKVPLDVASIDLFAADGRPLLRNTAFADGMDHWFFTADHHLAWHAKSMPLAVLFDLGVLGLLSMGGLLALGLLRAGRAAWQSPRAGRAAWQSPSAERAAWQGQRDAAALLVSLLVFASVGAIDSLIDTPRFLMLWLLLCCFAAEAGHAAEPESAMPKSTDMAAPEQLQRPST